MIIGPAAARSAGPIPTPVCDCLGESSDRNCIKSAQKHGVNGVRILASLADFTIFSIG